MTITQSHFFELLSGIKQYRIPIYQRSYAWRDADCARLLEDIVKAGTPGNANHYIGSIIIKGEPETGGVNICNVIDGQQRITTVSLLLLALKEYWTQNLDPAVPATTAAILGNIKDIYLTNGALVNTNLFTKILPKYGSDRNEYDNLLNEVVGNGRISRNYEFFLRALTDRQYDPSVIFRGINNAQLALVALDANENPQLLFEAVNDTGVDLTQVDLVRNWIFMGLSGTDQDRLYRQYWEPMETMLPDSMDELLFYFTRLKARALFDRGDYYRGFKKTFIMRSGTCASVESLLREISQYAGLYARYIAKDFSNRRINSLLEGISNTGKEVFTPLILKILNQWKGNSVSADDTAAMLKYLEAYIVRRDILGMPSRSLSEIMIEFLAHSDSLADFVECICNLSYRRKMPDDNEMLNQLQHLNFFNLRGAYYYLERIEKSLNPAFALVDPTIEHILPETMHTTAFPKENVTNPDDFNWELDLGAEAQVIHDKFQHTLGNLTILPRGENARMGDYRFEKKRDWRCSAPDGFNYGYRYTPIRISQSLGNFNAWNEESILRRCKEMVGYICALWPHP